jgi:protoporphyrinogen oxidase
MNTLVDTKETNGHHMVYLPKYVLSSDPFLKKEDAEIQAIFFEGLKKMYPGFSMDQVISVHLHRATKVQPLQTLNYSSIIPEVETKHSDFFIVNTSQFVKETLNNNSVVAHVKNFLHQHGTALGYHKE